MAREGEEFDAFGERRRFSRGNDPLVFGETVTTDDDGQIFFVGDLADAATGEFEGGGLFTGAEPLLRSEGLIPGGDGATISFSRQLAFAVNGSGELALTGFARFPGEPFSERAVFGPDCLIQRDSDQVPDAADGIVFEGFSEPALNDGGGVAIPAFLDDPSGPFGRLDAVVRSNGMDPLDVLVRTGRRSSSTGRTACLSSSTRTPTWTSTDGETCFFSADS